MLVNNIASKTFLDRNDKTKAATEFKFKDNFIKIGAEDDEETIKEFFESKLFYQPSKQDIKLYNEPEKAKDLIHIVGLLLYFKRISLPIALQDPGKFINFLKFTL